MLIPKLTGNQRALVVNGNLNYALHSAFCPALIKRKREGRTGLDVN